MKTQLLDLQTQCDNLRLQLKNQMKFKQFDEGVETQKQLHSLDSLLSRLVKSEGLSFNKFGRLV